MAETQGTKSLRNLLLLAGFGGVLIANALLYVGGKVITAIKT